MKRAILIVILLIITICIIILPSMPLANSELNISLIPTNGFDSTSEHKQIIHVGTGTPVSKESSNVVKPKYPDSVKVGDLAILQVVVGDTSTKPTSLWDWNLLFGPDSTGVGRQWIYYRFTEGLDSGQEVVVNFNNSACLLGRIYTFRNVDHIRFVESDSFGYNANSDTIFAQNVAVTCENCLAVSFVFITDNLHIDSFSSETTGDWLEATEYVSDKGEGGCIQLQTATLGSNFIVNGGYDQISSSASWGVRAFALRPVYTLTSTDLEKLESSNNNHYQTRTEWPYSGYDDWQGKCLHFDFSGTLPIDAHILSVTISNEFYRSSGEDGTFIMKMRVWDGSIWSSDYPIAVPYPEDVRIQDVSDFIDSAEKANALKIELKGAYGTSIKTSHDQVRVDITYMMPSFTISVTQSLNGFITPGTTVVNSGGSQDFQITPDSNFFIESIKIDDVDVAVSSPEGQTVSFTNIEADHTLTASFASINQPTQLTIKIDPETIDKYSGTSATISGFLASNSICLEGYDVVVSYNSGVEWIILTSTAKTDENGYYSVAFPVSPETENGYVAFSASFAGAFGYSAAETVFTGTVGGVEGNLYVVTEYVFGGLVALSVCVFSYVFFKKRSGLLGLVK